MPELTLVETTVPSAEKKVLDALKELLAADTDPGLDDLKSWVDQNDEKLTQIMGQWNDVRSSALDSHDCDQYDMDDFVTSYSFDDELSNYDVMRSDYFDPSDHGLVTTDNLGDYFSPSDLGADQLKELAGLLREHLQLPATEPEPQVTEVTEVTEVPAPAHVRVTPENIEEAGERTRNNLFFAIKRFDPWHAPEMWGGNNPAWRASVRTMLWILGYEGAALTAAVDGVGLVKTVSQFFDLPDPTSGRDEWTAWKADLEVRLHASGLSVPGLAD